MDATKSCGSEVRMLNGLCLLHAVRTIGQYAFSAPAFEVGWRIIARSVVIVEQVTKMNMMLLLQAYLLGYQYGNLYRQCLWRPLLM